jgi:hypothetical protein
MLIRCCLATIAMGDTIFFAFNPNYFKFPRESGIVPLVLQLHLNFSQNFLCSVLRGVTENFVLALLYFCNWLLYNLLYVLLAST